MTKWVFLVLIGIICVGLVWLQWGGAISGGLGAARDALLRANAEDRTAIDALKGENATAREEIARLKDSARQAEARAQAWQAQAAKAQAQAQDFKAQRDRLVQERASLVAITTVDQAVVELRRLGY